MAFFASKTVDSIRAPDQYLYPAPFNASRFTNRRIEGPVADSSPLALQLIELVILPLEFIVSKRTYARINRVLMTTLFIIPMCVHPRAPHILA